MTETFADTARVDACGGHIYSVDTHYVRPGLDASHIMVAGDEVAFVDTGVNSSVPGLLAALSQLKLAPEAVRYVFLTHIHLDHAGGAGLLMKALPNAELVVHPRGSWHMASPAKLVAGATAVYGEERFRALYGEIEPVPKSRLKIPKDGDIITLGGRSLEVIYTEGHARHHYCLWHPDAGGIFTGDSFGISYRVFDSANGALVFPTTTPVHFDPEAAHASVDRIVDTGARFAILTHYSRVDGLPSLAKQLHRDLDAFVDIALSHEHADDDVMERALMAYLVQRVDDHGVSIAPSLRDEWLAMDVKLNVQGLRHWLATRPTEA